MSQITSHVLDTSIGKPATGVIVILSVQENEDWKEMSREVTNIDGRVTDLVKGKNVQDYGMYRLRFETGQYYKTRSVPTFYPYVDIIFEIQSTEHYHIPLLLNPFGYSTYRGS